MFLDDHSGLVDVLMSCTRNGRLVYQKKKKINISKNEIIHLMPGYNVDIKTMENKYTTMQKLPCKVL